MNSIKDIHYGAWLKSFQFLPSKSCKVASLRLLLPKLAAASSHCFRLVGYSLPVSVCLTLELVIRITSPGSAKGTAVASKDLKRFHFGNKHFDICLK